jgi:two-component system CheB/CheR fusion protein
LESCAPATVLINRSYECLYSLGPTDTYLKVAPGYPMQDLVAMARDGVRTKLRSAIHRAYQENRRIVVDGGQIKSGGEQISFSISAQPVVSDGEELLLISFTDGSKVGKKQESHTAPQETPHNAELERELEIARADLREAVHNFEALNEEQRAINEEALSVNEEYQATNEELLTSKEELQSLNEQLNALNFQLNEMLERQRTTSNDLQNILYSSDVATLFLDSSLNIRFFTPAIKSLFRVIPSDIGRPLADLKPICGDDSFLADAAMVVRTPTRIEQEIETADGSWYIRSIMPYRTQTGSIEGVVITFVDITERQRVSDALRVAKHQAEAASAAKSHFLAAASHDLRQPLQALTLLQGLLATVVEGDRAKRLVGRLDETLGAMSGMLNTLLDINEIDTGIVQPEITDFLIDDLLDRLKVEFAYQAQAQGLDLRVVRSGITIKSDPGLLEQMIRNLLSNALKYTEEGKVILGCRRRGGNTSIEIWDTGIGIPEDGLESIFDEYRQLNNPARERKRGMGLGLSIVRRLGILLGHRVSVRSTLGRGSVFAIEVEGWTGKQRSPESADGTGADKTVVTVRQTGTILVIEDDTDLRALLMLILEDDAYQVTAAFDGVSALELADRGSFQPDLVLADYNLPNGANGLEVAIELRERFGREIPVIILTADMSAETLRHVALKRCVQLHKPVKRDELLDTIQRLLAVPPDGTLSVGYTSGASVVFVVEDDNGIRAGIRGVLEAAGHVVEDYADGEAFLEAYRPGSDSCLLLDAHLPGMSGFDLMRRITDQGHPVPAIMITGSSDVRTVVQAMKAGVCDFIEKPVRRTELLASVGHALEEAHNRQGKTSWREAAAVHLSGLTRRQRQIMEMVLDGHPSKNIAADLGISQRTVENHRAEIMRKTGTKSLPALARMVLAATRKDYGEPVR